LVARRYETEDCALEVYSSMRGVQPRPFRSVNSSGSLGMVFGGNYDHNGHMNHSVAKAKAKLSELIRAAHSDQQVIITDHGRPVARIVPYPPKEAATLEERLVAFERSGLLRAAPDESGAPWPAARRRPGALKRFTRDR
jgi:prevent-host-death family protein